LMQTIKDFRRPDPFGSFPRAFEYISDSVTPSSSYQVEATNVFSDGGTFTADCVSGMWPDGTSCSVIDGCGPGYFGTGSDWWLKGCAPNQNQHVREGPFTPGSGHGQSTEFVTRTYELRDNRFTGPLVNAREDVCTKDNHSGFCEGFFPKRRE